MKVRRDLYGLTALTSLGLAAGLLCLVHSSARAAQPRNADTPAVADSPDRQLARDIAKTITTRLATPTTPTKSCPTATRVAMRGMVEAVIAARSPSRGVAGMAIEFARQGTPPEDACRLAALDESATELLGNGELVDDGDSVRGFTLYMGPLPPEHPAPPR
jgi:hypothetical protein